MSRPCRVKLEHVFSKPDHEVLVTTSSLLVVVRRVRAGGPGVLSLSSAIQSNAMQSNANQSVSNFAADNLSVNIFAAYNLSASAFAADRLFASTFAADGQGVFEWHGGELGVPSPVVAPTARTGRPRVPICLCADAGVSSV